MTVRVVRNWSGGDRFSFTLFFTQDGNKHHHTMMVRGDQWSREAARAAKNDLQLLYNIPRRNVHFNTEAA